MEDNRAKEQYVHQSYTELNPLTGLYFNRAFFEKADEFLEGVQAEKYTLVAIDIAHFRLFNKFYGRKEGDKFLKYVADCIKKIEVEYNGISGYLGGDNFCLVIPDKTEIVKELEAEIQKGIEQYNNAVSFYPIFGVFAVGGNTMSAVAMYDLATITLSRETGKYANRICRYDPSVEEKFEEELKLLSEIQDALKDEEFTFYAQPQCDILTGKIVGAESLVRWQHKTKGLVSPGLFIPVLEKNGLIDQLDRYVWEKVCKWLRNWIDRGHRPVPISVNVSRIDILAMNVPEFLKNLTKKYDLSPKYLKVEITESAYSESNDEINDTVKELRDYGFKVMMDDFGSGYSSLNMLKNVSIDVLKLDMRFLDIKDQEEKKGIGILESVVNMARLMGLPIIVEGVETQKQEDFLQKLGCRYIQGYYYYRPLPLEQFEDLMADEQKLDFGGLWCKQVEAVHVRELMDRNLFDDTMVNNIMGAAAFYEVYGDQIEITRVNEQYYQLTGVSTDTSTNYETKMGNHVREDDRTALLSIFQQAYENPVKGAEGGLHFLRTDGKVLWMYLRVFFLNENDGRKMFYGSLVDMTTLHNKRKEVLCEKGVNELSEKQQNSLEKHFGKLPFGYSVGKVVLDDNQKAVNYEIVYANKEMKRISGDDIERLRYIIDRVFANDYEEVMNKLYRSAYQGKREDYNVYSPMSRNYMQLTFYQYEYGYVSCILRDVTHMHIYEGTLNSIMTSYREVYYVQLQDNYCRMIYPDEKNVLERGDYDELINRHFGMGKILDDDEQNVREFLSLDNLKNELQDKNTIECRYLRHCDEYEDEWCVTSFIVCERDNGVPTSAVMTIRSIDTILREEEEKRRKNMAQTLANMSDGFFIYSASGEERILYANPQVVRLFGCETMMEFRGYVNNSFQCMVHKEDLERVQMEIGEQIAQSEDKLDHVQYRIVRKNGEVRWVDDWGHLEASNEKDKLYYVFISDITDTMTEQKKEELLRRNEYF